MHNTPHAPPPPYSYPSPSPTATGSSSTDHILPLFVNSDEDVPNGGFGYANPAILPDNLVRQKTYLHGPPADVFPTEITGDTLADDMDGLLIDPAPAPLASADIVNETIDVRVRGSGFGYGQGSRVTITEDGQGLQASGPSARGIGIMPRKGVATVVYLHEREAYGQFVSSPPASDDDMDSIFSSDVPDDLPIRAPRSKPRGINKLHSTARSDKAAGARARRFKSQPLIDSSDEEDVEALGRVPATSSSKGKHRASPQAAHVSTSSSAGNTPKSRPSNGPAPPPSDSDDELDLDLDLASVSRSSRTYSSNKVGKTPASAVAAKPGKATTSARSHKSSSGAGPSKSSQSSFAQMPVMIILTYRIFPASVGRAKWPARMSSAHTRALIPAADAAVKVITPKVLARTPYEASAPEIISAVRLFGSAMLDVVVLALDLEKRFPHGKLPHDRAPRPAHLKAWIGNRRKCVPGVVGLSFDTFPSDVRVWWAMNQPPQREADHTNGHLGAIPANADWSKLGVSGGNGFCLVVIALVLWRQHIESASKSAQLPAWCELLLDVKSVLEAMLSPNSDSDASDVPQAAALGKRKALSKGSLSLKKRSKH